MRSLHDRTDAPPSDGWDLLARYLEGEPWMDEAACRDADREAFFPGKEETGREARRICNGTEKRPPCPVRAICLEWAIDNEEQFGIYGGLSERQRRKFRRHAA